MAATTPESESDISPVQSPGSEDGPTSPISPNPSAPAASAGLAVHPTLSHRSTSANASMTSSSTPLGNVNAARRPAAPTISSSRGGLNGLPPEMMARMQAFHLNRQGGAPGAGARGPPAGNTPSQPAAGGPVLGGPAGRFPGLVRPGQPTSFASAPAVPGVKKSMAERRGMALPGGLPGSPVAGGSPAPGKRNPGLKLTNAFGDAPAGNAEPPKQQSALDKYSNMLDAKTGTLNFKDKAILDSQGVKFAGGTSFQISLDEVDTLDELGKGNYGTVYKVRHSRPRIRKVGQGLAGNKSLTPASPTTANDGEETPTSAKSTGGTGIIMAMKEMRLELDDSKFATIIMELDILHRCVSPYIIDFYGAFFQEGAVYICIEFMDGGSVDKLYLDGVPENVLRKITYATTKGLKFLKEEHNIIHRDVKPTNILMNTQGHIKICDFGVSGNLVASIAKTNIGCQSYMAPERISSGGVAQAGANPGGGTYSVQSDIWSLGLTIIECALGQYPYPPETYDNIFSQLSAIVDGDPPDLPTDSYSEAARNFVSGCLNKIPNLRPTYPMLLQHAWLAPLDKPETILEESEDEEAAQNGEDIPADAGMGFGGEEKSGMFDVEVGTWVRETLEKKKKGVLGKGRKSIKPALHAAPLDATASPGAAGTPQGTGEALVGSAIAA